VGRLNPCGEFRHQIGLLAAAQRDNIHLTMRHFSQATPFRMTFRWCPMHHQALTFNDAPLNCGADRDEIRIHDRVCAAAGEQDFLGDIEIEDAALAIERARARIDVI